MRELSLNNCRIDKRYDIRETLGRGSYAEIFLAADTLASPQSPHSQVVIKALNVFLQDDLDSDLERTLVENFQNEAIALDRVRHPNIISRIGHGTARDLKGTVFHYLVLEYLSGGDLQNAVRKRELPLIQVLNYVEQICAGLGHAHRNGIIHRDIKPQNLLLTADLATVKIADFGVARFSVAASPITRVGTNVYAPPEHSPMTAGGSDAFDEAPLTPAADIYSLAKSIYTLITREAPRGYANRPIDDLPAAFRYEEWADDLIRVLKRATQSDPGMRPQTVEDLWIDLSAVRRIAADGEESTVIRSRTAEPQPHVARGYTPIVPEQPNFESIDEARIDTPPPTVRTPLEINIPRPVMPPAQKGRQTVAFSPYAPPMKTAIGGANAAAVAEKPKRKSRKLRAFAIFLVLIASFGGILYGTANYMRGRVTLPEIRNPFKVQTAVANTDVFLRQGPNADTDKIGLVTKRSKVKIVNSQNNWYQVDVIEQGQARNTPLTATRGWLNGKFLDIDNN
ncbi:MAG: protein kinase [Pyrinomonadaceae bacterium]|nr:protein kinase [Pyrinomonadaceae bacterium]